MAYLEQFDATPVNARWALVRNWMFAEPLGFYAELRERRPILPMPEVTLATRFNDCTEILQSADLFSTAHYKLKQGDYWMAQDDTAAHWREKSIMRAVLDRDDVPAIRLYVAEKAAKLLAEARPPFDAVAGLTRAVPIALVQDWFGYADSDPEDLRRWSYCSQTDTFWNQPFDSVAVPDPAHLIAQRETAMEGLRPYLIGLVQRRGAELRAGQAGNDPITKLLRLSLSGAINFDLPRVVLNAGGLLIGAVETTSHAVVNALDVLMSDADRFAAARAAALSEDATEIDGFVFEAMRFKPAFPYFFRTCERDTCLGRGSDYETAIAQGTTVLAVTHSAMFDRCAFHDPDQFEPRRGTGNAFHFGYGIHECLGRAVAGVMVAEIVRQSLRLNNLRAGPVDRRGGPVPESWEWRWH